MSWTIDPHATRVAAELFKPHRPVVKRNDSQYVIEATPYGRVELISLPGGHFLAAAESPPLALPAVEQARLSRDLLGHLQRNRRLQWKVVLGGDAAEALHHLLQYDPPGDGKPRLLTWLPYACKLIQRGKLIGRARLPVAEQLAATIRAHKDGDPLPALVGPPGVGKRVTLLAVAERLDMSAVELPLRRIFTDRILQTPMECFLDTVLVAAKYAAEDDLIAVSDADLTTSLPPNSSQQAMLELSRLPNVALLTSSGSWATEKTPGVVPIACAGLADMGEASGLLAIEEPSLAFVGPALSMICRAASLPGVGIIPGRLLYLARLAKSLTAYDDSSRPQSLSPDEVAPAISIGQDAWREHDTAV